jgi:DNA-binding NtrC family response regulator
MPAKSGGSPRAAPQRATANAPEATDLNLVERNVIEKAMHDARFNKSRAARLLGVTRAQLYAKLRRHGLD